MKIVLAIPSILIQLSRFPSFPFSWLLTLLSCTLHRVLYWPGGSWLNNFLLLSYYMCNICPSRYCLGLMFFCFWSSGDFRRSSLLWRRLLRPHYILRCQCYYLADLAIPPLGQDTLLTNYLSFLGVNSDTCYWCSSFSCTLHNFCPSIGSG